MFTSITLAVHVDNPLAAAKWHNDILGLSGVMDMGNDVYEIQIMPDFWMQFYSDPNGYSNLSFTLRLGVDNLDSITYNLQQHGWKIEPKLLQGIHYLFSQQTPWEHKIGFYELQDEGDKKNV